MAAPLGEQTHGALRLPMGWVAGAAGAWGGESGLLRGRAGCPPYLNRTSTTATNAVVAATSPHDLGLPQFIAQPTPKRRGTTTEGSSRFT